MPNTIHGYELRWTSFCGEEMRAAAISDKSEQCAQKQAILAALREGWRYPRWWQWWRRHDTRPPMALVSDVVFEEWF